MYAIILSKKLDKFGVHYGWVMAVLAFLTTVFSSASFSMPHVLILPITAEFNWKISDVTTPISLMFLTLATMAPFGSALMLRFGVARVVATTGVFIAIGLICTTQIFLKWHLLISIGVFLGIAAGMIGLGLTATVATRWFSARRGLVVGILTAGFAAGQLTFVPLAAWLAANYDWRLAVLPALIGSAFAAFAAGETRDSVLTYLPAFVTAGISCFIAVLFVIAFRRYRPIVA